MSASTTTTRRNISFDAVRACTIPWCMSHLEPVESGLALGQGWIRDDNDTRITRLHQHHGEQFDLAVFEVFNDGEHEVDTPVIENRHNLDLTPSESLEAAAELQRLANLANA